MSSVLATSTRSPSLKRKLDWRILPFFAICYMFAFLDRVNIGFAKLQMQSDLGLSDVAYGLGAGIFFLGYVLFEIPSNLLLPRIGARKTFSRIMILWGLTSSAMFLVKSEAAFYALRFLLGVFEAGFAPGMIFYLTYWYGRANMARALALVMLAAPLGSAIAGPLSTWIMTSTHGAAGLSGWQWMFLIEGLPSAILGCVAWFFLTDHPSQAKWLTAEEKAQVLAEAQPDTKQPHSFAGVLRDRRLYVLAAAYFCFICGLYTLSFWLPTIIKAAGVTDLMHVGLYSALPHLAGAVAMVMVSRSSDRRGERRWHSASTATLAAILLAASTIYSDHIVTVMVCMTLAGAMMYSAYTVFWAMPSEYVKGDAAAGGIALINTIGLIGGFVSPSIMGLSASITGALQTGILTMAMLLLLGAVLVLSCQRPTTKE